MEQIGYITNVEGHMAEMEVKRVSACGGGSCNSCGGSCEVKAEYITIPNTLNAKVGDFVEVKTEASLVLSYLLLIYGVPLLFLIVGTVAAVTILEKNGVANYNLYGALIGLLVMALSFGFIKLADKKAESKTEEIIRMERIL
ncbi:MAG: SoxR reducing system RseC family protein [Tissierellia bacterium]|nr:SoxR reducing system RseC family protein [Tissierellia bacterium]